MLTDIQCQRLALVMVAACDVFALGVFAGAGHLSWVLAAFFVVIFLAVTSRLVFLGDRHTKANSAS